MENNSENLKNENVIKKNQTNNDSVKQSSNNGKKKTILLVGIILVLVLGIGICVGILFSKGNTKIFNITEQKEQNNETKAVAVIVNERQKLMTIKDGKIYLCDWGKLYILDLATGNVLYKNTETNIGGGTAYIFDENNNLYVIAYLTGLNVFNEEANCIKTVSNLEAGYSMDQQMSIENNQLIIKYNFPQGNEAKTYDSDIINLNDLFDNSDKIKPEDLVITNQSGYENLIGINNQTENKESAYADEYVKIIDQVISENENVNRIKCDLIYFNEDDIPDLVIDHDSLVKVYMYENGTVYNPINESYGTGGCKYYDYYEKRGVISSFGTSLAGATCGESFYILNSKKEMEYTFSYTVKGAEPEDEEMKKQMEEELNKYGGYYYKGQKITEEEFESKLKEYGIEFSTEKLWNTESSIKKALTGTKSLLELKKQLGK